MARDLAAGNNRWSTTVFHTSTSDFSMGLWLMFDGNQASETRIFMNGGTPNTYGIDCQGGGTDVSGIHEGLVRFGKTTLTAGVWYHCMLTRGGGTSTFYVDGVARGTEGGAPNTPSGNCQVGADFATSIDGKVADAAMWSVALTIDEIVSLARGFSPEFVRPQSLLSYWRLLGKASPEPDFKSGRNLTLTGSSAEIVHPRIITPRTAIYLP